MSHSGKFGKYEKTSVVILQEREVQESLACRSAQAAGTSAHTGHAELAWRVEKDVDSCACEAVKRATRGGTQVQNHYKILHIE